MSPPAEDSSSSSKPNGSANGTGAHLRDSSSSGSTSTFTAVNGNSRSADSSSTTIRVGAPVPPVPAAPAPTTSPGQQTAHAHSNSNSTSHQSHSHNHIAHVTNSTHRSQTASHGSQSGSGDDEDAGDHSDLSGSNLQSPVTPNSHHDPKYIHAAADRLPLGHQSNSPESYTHQKRKRSNSSEPGARVETYGHREMSSDIVHPQYHGHSMPMTNDIRMADAGNEGGRDEMPDRHASEHIAQRASEEAAKLEDMRARDPANFEVHVQQLQNTPQSDHLRSFDANVSPNMTPTNGVNRTSGQPETKRKRIFSNRTKTGCITCRRRKKKCDEGKPACNNCKRGGFPCEGYTAPINTSFATITAPVMRPADRPATLPPPDYTRHQPSQPTVPQTTLPPPAEPKPFGATGLPLSGPAPPPQSQPLRRDSQVMQPLPAPELPKAQPQVSPFSGPRVPPQPPLPQRFSASSEKERMLNGELFHAFTPELIEERERCRAACWRFNNAANPTLCISREEKLRLQMEIFRPSAGTRGPQGSAWGGDIVNAHLRKNLGLQDPVYPVNEEPWIEVPFMCDYGYNITLGPGVFINFGCTIIDTCQVTIKARTLIGPNVNIYSGTHPLNPRTRNGTKGPEFGKPVIIEEDCWIAGNVTILPGVKIGVGATVGAGAVVTRDVPPHTVVAGNPAKVIKGIMEHE
ncbi:Maltose acetyltransferase [Orbilia brochopaga]|uniref:Maltose acetyltransferase n=1 Tax=Orbilia brochopaga TaxID=3140254 RepID=A0AAV9VBZ4_9PEZI